MRSELIVTCVYTTDGTSARALLLESFQMFLRGEMESVAKR